MLTVLINTLAQKTPIHMEFDMPKENSSIIKVIGVGGGGNNAVNHMYQEGITGVDFIVVNTDQQALDISPVPTKVQVGGSLTEGMGAGSVPEIGRNAATEDINGVKEYLEQRTKMVFVTAGMGGGTGTGAAPVIASAAREMGILTVGIVTLPFNFEGKRRKEQAEEGVQAMRQSVDTLLIICNDRLREMYGNLNLSNAFAQADDVLATAAKGIAEVITVTGQINVDFKDVNTVMKDSGVAILGSSRAQGENRALQAVEKALSSPLLNDNDIAGAQHVLLNITYGEQEVLMDEIAEITDHIQEEAGSTADVIWGHGKDPTLEDEDLSVTIIATGFESGPRTGSGLDQKEKEEKKRYVRLDEEQEEKTSDAAAASSPQGSSEPVNEAKEVERSSEAGEEGMPYLKGPSSSDNGDSKHQPSLYHREELKKEDDEGEEQEAFSGPSVEERQRNGNEGGEEPIEDRKAAERMGRIREMTMKLRSHSRISDLEKEPAYRRKNIELEDQPPSDRSEVSRYSLSSNDGEETEQKPGIRENNSYLHDKPD